MIIPKSGSINIRHIETFLAVVDASSFRRASEALHRSQSAVSAHVQQLEQALGVPLLERTTRRVTLTSAGQTLYRRCRVVVADIRSVAQELKDESTLRRGRVSIGASPSVATHRLAPIIAEFHAGHPGVDLELHEAFARRLYEDVLERVTDFAIGPKLPRLRDFDVRTVLRDPLVVVLPATRKWTGRANVRVEELAGEVQLGMPRETAIRSHIEDAFRDKKLSWNPAFEAIHLETLFSLVEAGLGVTVLPYMAVPTKPRNFVVAQLCEPAITREVCLVTLKGRTLTPAASLCAEKITTALRAQATSRGNRRITARRT